MTTSYRGDLIVRAGTTCVGRYGTITDATTKKPVSGAKVSIVLGNATATVHWTAGIESTLAVQKMNHPF